MIAPLAKWETTLAPAVSIEQTENQTMQVFWGVLIPAIPDLLSIEQARTGMTYETALSALLQSQQQWIKQLHNENRFTLSLRIITSGDPEQDLIFGLVGKTEGQNEAETIAAARNFFNKVRDTFPNGYYPLQPCLNIEELALLRLPFLPSDRGTLAEFRRNLTQLRTISSNDIPDTVGVQIDPWQAHPSNFQDLFRALLGHPSPLAVSIDIRPTRLTPQESEYIARLVDAYARVSSISRSETYQTQVLSSSVSSQEKLTEAEGASQSWHRSQSGWRSPFELTVSIMSESDLPQSVVAALQGSIDGKSEEKTQSRGSGSVIVAQSEAQKMAVRQNWVDLTMHRWANTYDLGRLPWLFSPEEVHSIFRLPIADRNGVWGLPSAPSAKDSRRPTQWRESEAEIRLGSLHLTKKQLTQHLLICGVPGSGKTNSCLYLLETLWREHRIPWMVLEPAKTEYRGLKTTKSIQDDLLIFTLGDERTAPFRFNPFELPTGLNLDSHLGALVDLFSVAMSMWGPLPNVVEQLIQEAYKRKGFTLLGENINLHPPQFSDLQVLIPEIVPKLGYKKETTDEIIAALAVRIGKFCRGSLGRMLNVSASVPFDLLMQRPVILEMSQVTNTDDRAFLMGLILNRCYQYWITRRHEATGDLKHLLLVEEAHNLLAHTQESTGQEQANPKGKAVRNFANMLAEVRGFGQGIAISEQNPGGLVPDVMVNTNIKIAHRIVEAKNRQALGQAMLLTPQQETTLAALRTGQMFYYVGGNPEPSITLVPNFKDDSANGFNPRLSDLEIRQSFQVFRKQYLSLYAPPTGCPTESHLSDCIEQGADLVQILLEDPRYKALKTNSILQLLAAPYGFEAKNALDPVLGKILIERGANHLSSDRIRATLDSAISLLALIAVQEKGKVHGWLGEQLQQAHRLLAQAIFTPNAGTQSQWINLCRIPDHILQLGLPHPEYVNCEAPGVFRYENKVLLWQKQEFFLYLSTSPDLPSIALQTWVKKHFSFLFPRLSPDLQRSLLVCVAIQLTEGKIYLLPKFLA